MTRDFKVNHHKVEIDEALIQEAKGEAAKQDGIGGSFVDKKIGKLEAETILYNLFAIKVKGSHESSTLLAGDPSRFFNEITECFRGYGEANTIQQARDVLRDRLRHEVHSYVFERTEEGVPALFVPHRTPIGGKKAQQPKWDTEAVLDSWRELIDLLLDVLCWKHAREIPGAPKPPTPVKAPKRPKSKQASAPAIKKHGSKASGWTAEEEEKLIRMYFDLKSDHDIADELGKSIYAVATKRIGFLRGKPPHPLWEQLLYEYARKQGRK